MQFLLTRNVIYALAAIFLVAVVFGVTKCSKSKSPKQPEIVEIIEKPNIRPERADLGQFTKYKGQSMEQILEAISSGEVESDLESKSAAAALISSLPNEPFPFPKEASPTNEIALKQFIQTIEGGNLGKPSMVDLWRYNLVSSALGKETDSLPEDLRLKTLPENRTENFPVKLTARESDLVGPLAIGDFDGVEGLEVISHGGTKMWTRSGDGSLVEKQGQEMSIAGSDVFPADFDNDGDLDLFIARRKGAPNSLLQNDGKAGFTDVTEISGLLSFSDTAAVAWTDYDQDGLLDILIGNHDHPFEIFRQVSAGLFEPVSWELDLWLPKPVKHIEVADFNNDSYPDLVLGIEGLIDQLLFSLPSSEPSNWRFLEKGNDNNLPFGVDVATTETFDFDNDGDLDLLIGKSSGDAEKRVSAALNGIDHESENHLQLYLNDGEGSFSDITEVCALNGVEDVEAIHVLDLDNDGFEDVFVVTGDMAFNRAFWNRGGAEFREVSQGSGLNYLNSPDKICSIDLDKDGRLDLFLSDEDGGLKWLEAENPGSNGWLGVNLENAPPGTRVKVLARDTDWILQPIYRRTTIIPELTIGLGHIDKIEQIEIFPPQSIKPVEILKKVQPNQTLNINIPEKNSQAAEDENDSPS